MKYIILCLSVLLCGTGLAQQSSKSKSKDRFREKNDRNFPVRVMNAGAINQDGSDSAPAFYKDGIVFVSNRTQNGGTAASLYYAFFNANSEPSFAQQAEFQPEKKSSFNDGPVCFSRDNKTVYMTLPNNTDGVLKTDKNGKTVLKIYESRYGSPNWTKPKELSFNSDEYSCMHPSISADGTKLFFASDMAGGQGGYDIYVVTRSGADWGTPVNLGPIVNTDKQEIFPFISKWGTLFFSSNGRPNSLGGFDNYYVANPLNNPEEVVNLGDGFNSGSDDMSLIVDPTGKNGFFTSNRARGAGKDDIYRFEAPRGLEGVGRPEVNPLQILVTDAKTGRPLQKAEIRILQPTDDGFVSKNKNFYTLDLVPEQSKSNAIDVHLVRKNAADLGMPDYYSNAEGKAQAELTRFQNYLIIVNLPGYQSKEQLVTVDNSNPVALTFKLSEAPPCYRAGGMVATKTFGSRIFNATIKFVHRETGQTTEILSNWNGEYVTCLPVEGEYVVYVSCAGFKDENYRLVISKNDNPFTETRLEPLEAEANVEANMPLGNSIQAGTLFILGNIFQDYQSVTLQGDAEMYLDAIYDLLKQYPGMEIDLTGHTDSRGDARLNQGISETRAINAKNYLLSRGIASNRIAAYGKGETDLRNRCKDGVQCSNEEHLQNDRLEVLVRKVQ